MYYLYIVFLLVFNLPILPKSHWVMLGWFHKQWTFKNCWKWYFFVGQMPFQSPPPTLWKDWRVSVLFIILVVHFCIAVL